MFNSQFYDNTRIQGFAVLKQTNAGDKPCQFAPLKKTLLEEEVSGPVADLFLTQIFVFQREEIEKEGSIEAIYCFPLPGDAAVTEILVTFGEVEIRTALLPRKQAEDEYKEVRDTHRQAVLLTRESPDVFTLSVSGIKAGEEVRIRTRFVIAGTPNQTGFSYRIPLTTAPRYVRETEIHTRHALKGIRFSRFRIPCTGLALNSDLSVQDHSKVRLMRFH